MVEKNENIADFTNFIANLYDDPIRMDTAQRGRWLVTASLATIAVSAFGAQIGETALLQLKFPKPGVLPGLLLVLVSLLLGEYFLRAAIDLLREREARPIVRRFIAAQKLDRLRREAREFDDAINQPEDEYPDEPDGWWEEFVKTEEREKIKVQKLEKLVEGREWPQRLRRLRLYAEVLTPIFLALIAIISTRHHFSEFCVAVWNAISS